MEGGGAAPPLFFCGGTVATGERIAALSGVVLAGGKSRRMGRDKRHLDVGGVGLLARVAEILGTVCGEVLIVTAEPEPHLHVGSGRLVRDEIPGKGTLGGIYTGLL